MILEKKPMATVPLVLVDLSSLIFRAFFAIRALKNSLGEPTNAVYGVATMLARLADEVRLEHLAIVFDSPEPSFRKQLYPAYKSHRQSPPEDLLPQFTRVEQLIQALGMPFFRQPGFEADDLIATLTRTWCALSPLHEVVIVSNDKDLMQLVGAQVSTWDTMGNLRYHAAEVQGKFGVRPDQIRDYLGLVGDSSDHIPGVPGIGPKSAVELLSRFQTLEGVLKAAAAGEIGGKKERLLVEHQDSARLSAQLATLIETVPLEVDLDALSYQFHLTEAGIKLFYELDFHALVAKWKEKKWIRSASRPGGGAEGVANKVAGDVGTPPARAQDALLCDPPGVCFSCVTTRLQLQAVWKALEQNKVFAVDLETTSLNPLQAKIVGIALCWEATSAVYIPIGHEPRARALELREGGEGDGGDRQQSLQQALILEGPVAQDQLAAAEVLAKLKVFLEDPQFKKIGQNLKYDWSVLQAHGIHPQGLLADTMVASYVLDASGRHNLAVLAEKYLQYDVLTYEKVCGRGKAQVSFATIPLPLATRYAAEDAWVAFRLWQDIEPKLQACGLMALFQTVDLPLVDVLARMEAQGISVDVAWMAELSREFAQDLAALEAQVVELVGEGVNLNSPKQLQVLLFEKLKLPPQGKTKTGFSTDADVLEKLAPLHPVPRLLLEYREIAKLKGTYIDPIPLLMDPVSHKVHASFHQTGTITGRLSSSEPNLQNIPIRSQRGMKIRRAFIPSPGCLWVDADYSQIELRLLAHLSQDQELLKAFWADEDVHARTASDIFAVKLASVSEEQRSVAKAVNFGLMYGKTAYGLSQELSLSRADAQGVIDRYFERYSGVKAYLEGQVRLARAQGFVQTVMGRKRPLPEISSSHAALRSHAERMAMNSPIQGSAADLMKMAMIALDETLRREKLQAKLILQIHDEVLIDCPLAEQVQVEKSVTQAMEGAMKLSVPLKVNVSFGSNWMDLKDSQPVQASAER